MEWIEDALNAPSLKNSNDGEFLIFECSFSLKRADEFWLCQRLPHNPKVLYTLSSLYCIILITIAHPLQSF